MISFVRVVGTKALKALDERAQCIVDAMVVVVKQKGWLLLLAIEHGMV